MKKVLIPLIIAIAVIAGVLSFVLIGSKNSPDNNQSGTTPSVTDPNVTTPDNKTDPETTKDPSGTSDPDTEHVYDNDCDKTCNVCGEEREITHSFDSEWSKDEDGHWHVCTVCGETDGVKAHVPGSEATETTAQKCKDCDYVIVEALGHTHNYKTEWSTDAEEHWHACSGCDVKKDDGEHVFDNACDTSCNTCGYERSVTHNYKTTWSSDSSSHWHECSVCGDKKDVADHKAGNGPTETEPQKCTVCGYVIKAALGHTHKYDTSWTKDSASHWHACSGCGDKKDLASHVYDNSCDTTCNNCGYTRTISHKYSTAWEKDSSSHWHKCTVCGVTDTKTAHKFDNACDTTCDTCSYVRTVTHSYGNDWQKDSTNHWKSCTVCSNVKDKQAHRYDNACDKDCNDCGQVRVTAHTYSNTLTSDSTGHWRVCTVCSATDAKEAHAYDNACDPSCNKCNYTREVSHSYEQTYTSDETNHWYKCSKCGAEDSKSAHEYTNNCDSICDICSYERTADHTFKTTYDNDENGHWYSCSICNAPGEVKDHVYDDPCDETCNECSFERVAEHSITAGWEYDTQFHWHECSKCGEYDILINHRYDDACDPDCNVCGYTRETAHNYSTKYSTNTTSHWYACTKCGDEKDKGSHEYNNSCDDTCNICNYRRNVTHNYSTAWSSNGQYHWHSCTTCTATTTMTIHKYDGLYDNVCNDCSYTEGIKVNTWLNPAYNKVTGGMIANDNGNVYDFSVGFGTSSHAPFSVLKRDKKTGSVSAYSVVTGTSTYKQEVTAYGTRTGNIFTGYTINNGVLRVDVSTKLSNSKTSNFNTFANPGHMYMLANGSEDILLCFTAPEDGTYTVRASATRAWTCHQNGTGSRFFIEVNGTVKTETTDPATSTPKNVVLTTTVTLKKGETIYFGHDPVVNGTDYSSAGLSDDIRLHYFIVEKEGTPKAQADRTTNKISVQMAKNEKESFQVSINSAKAVSGMKFIQTSGSASNISIEYLQEATVMINGIPVPDPIYPFSGSFTVNAGETKTLLIRFVTNQNTKAGTYTYTFELRSPNNRTLEKYEVTLTVWNFTLPEDTSCETATGLSSDQITAKEGSNYYVQYYEMLLDYRMNAYNLPYDILDSRADKYMSDPRVTSFQVPWGASDAKIIEYYKKLKTNPEWLEKAYFYPYDEPNDVDAMNTLAARCQKLRELAPEIHIVIPFFTNIKYSSTMDSVDFLEQYIDIWCPKAACWNSSFIADPLRRGSFASRMQGMKDKGDKLWWYVCWEPGAPYCNLYLNERGVDHRILFWQQYMSGVDGFLYWQSTYWNYVSDPWTNMATVGTWLNEYVYGDGSLLYPGKKVGVKGPCASLRLENVRDGIEDFEMFKLAEQKLGKSWVITQINKVTTSVTSHNYSSENFSEVRKAIGDALSNAS